MGGEITVGSVVRHQDEPPWRYFLDQIRTAVVIAPVGADRWLVVWEKDDIPRVVSWADITVMEKEEDDDD